MSAAAAAAAVAVARWVSSFEAEGDPGKEEGDGRGPLPPLTLEERSVDAEHRAEEVEGRHFGRRRKSSDAEEDLGRRRLSVARERAESRVFFLTYRHRAIYPRDGPRKGQGSFPSVCHQMAPSTPLGQLSPWFSHPGK